MTLLQTKVVKYVVVYRLPYMVVLSGLFRSMAIGCTSRISRKIETSFANCQVFTHGVSTKWGGDVCGQLSVHHSHNRPASPSLTVLAATVGGLLCLLGHFLAVGSL